MGHAHGAPEDHEEGDPVLGADAAADGRRERLQRNEGDGQLLSLSVLETFCKTTRGSKRGWWETYERHRVPDVVGFEVGILDECWSLVSGIIVMERAKVLLTRCCCISDVCLVDTTELRYSQYAVCRAQRLSRREQCSAQ